MKPEKTNTLGDALKYLLAYRSPGIKMKEFEEVSKHEAIPLCPSRDRLLVELEDTQYKGTLVIPDTAKDASFIGRVVAVGPGRLCDDPEGPYFESLITIVGDRIIFAKYAGATLEWDGKKYLILREEEIDCYVVEEDK